jgi:uncharacterized protein (DUF2062 family)
MVLQPEPEVPERLIENNMKSIKFKFIIAFLIGAIAAGAVIIFLAMMKKKLL